MSTPADTALPVWKMIYLAQRNPQLRAEDFPQAWREHSALGRQCKNVGQRVKAVAQCARLLPHAAPALSSHYDGVNLMVLADREAGQAIWEDSETLSIMRPDEPRVFADYVRNFSMLCSQHVLHSTAEALTPPKNGQVLLIGFLQRSPAWPGPAAAPQTCPPAWRTASLAQAQRVVCNTVQDMPPAGYGFAHIVEWWFDTEAAALQAAHDLQQWPTHGPEDCGDSVFMLTTVTHSRP